MPTRRTLFSFLGASVALSAGGAGYWAATRAPEAATRPWDLAARPQDPLRFALAHAILAPNAHNMQSWLIELDGADGFRLYADPDKLLPHTDPFSRQIAISLGAFLELFRIAAAELGYATAIIPFPEGTDPQKLDARPVAAARLTSGGAPDPLYARIIGRRTCKDPFEARAVSTDAMTAIAAATETPEVAVGQALAPERVRPLAELALRAHEVEVTTQRTLLESVEVMRIGRAEIQATPDGIDLQGPFLEALNLAGLLTREQLADPTSTAFAQGLEMYRTLILSARGFFWLTTADNTRAAQLKAGRAWVRAQLQATELGIDMHPLSQALQEYPEMAALYREAHESLAASGGTVQMFARVGYGPKTRPSPRWPLEAKLV